MSGQPATTLDVERSRQHSSLPEVFYALMEKTGGSIAFLPESLKLLFGPGKISFDEYVTLRLWDAKFCRRSSLGGFIGNRALAKIFKTANFMPGASALVTNKIAATAVLGAYGLASPAIAGLHAAAVLPGPGRTSTPAELEAFLLRDLTYPAFGKPLSGRQSLGSVSFDSCDRSSGTLLRQDGRTLEAKIFAREVHDIYAKEGYLFQPRLAPHETVRAVCGERTATVRILTMFTPGGPRVHRACWKIPAAGNWADNFWRPGNLLAGFDLDDGVITRVVSGSGVAMTEIGQHPDTHARFEGMKVPLWEELRAAALAGAEALPEFGLLGWDMAAAASGAVVVEVNDTPDPMLHQIADRRGIKDNAFKTFLAQRRDAGEIWKRELQAMLRKENAPSWQEHP